MKSGEVDCKLSLTSSMTMTEYCSGECECTGSRSSLSALIRKGMHKFFILSCESNALMVIGGQ